MDKNALTVAFGIITGIYLTSRFIKPSKQNRPNLETINDYHLYNGQQDHIKNGTLFNNNNNNISNNQNQNVPNLDSQGTANYYYPNNNMDASYGRLENNLEMKKPIGNQENYVSPYAHLMNNEPGKK